MKRRRLLGALSGLGALGGLAPLTRLRAEPVMPSTACRPTMRQTLGPYLLPDSPERSDVREAAQGTPLRLTLNVVDDYFCKPIEGARVEIWHSDSRGLYSGVPNDLFDLETMQIAGEPVDMTGSTFLRGHQTTGASGKVEFTTIVPGWYTGRLPHIHVRTIVRDLAWTEHSTQLYLPREVERAVYETGPYSRRGQNPLSMDRDLVVRGDAAALNQLTLALEKDGAGYRGSFDLAVSF